MFDLDKKLEEEKDVKFEYGIKSKKILLYSGNSVGKSYQSSKFPKPFLIMTESGGGALNCLKEPCNTWEKFKDIVNDLTKEKNLKKRQSQVETVIIDTAENLVDLSERAVCKEFGVRDLSEIKGRENGYKIARTEFSLFINKLTNCGYCVIFIAHEEKVEKTDPLTGETYIYLQPKNTSNEKSSMRMLRDLCDFCIYLRPNGLNDKFEVIPSTAICRETKYVFARSRFAMQTFIDPFTAKGLISAIEEAVKKSAEEEDAGITEYIENKEKLTAKDYIENINPYIEALWETCEDEVTNLIINAIGEGRKLSEVGDDEISKLEVLYNNLLTKAMIVGIEV